MTSAQRIRLVLALGVANLLIVTVAFGFELSGALPPDRPAAIAAGPPTVPAAVPGATPTSAPASTPTSPARTSAPEPTPDFDTLSNDSPASPGQSPTPSGSPEPTPSAVGSVDRPTETPPAATPAQPLPTEAATAKPGNDPCQRAKPGVRAPKTPKAPPCRDRRVRKPKHTPPPKVDGIVEPKTPPSAKPNAATTSRGAGTALAGTERAGVAAGRGAR